MEVKGSPPDIRNRGRPPNCRGPETRRPSMAQALPRIATVRNSRVAFVVWGFSAALVAICTGIASYALGDASTKTGVSDLTHVLPLAINAGSLLVVFALMIGLTFHLNRKAKRL